MGEVNQLIGASQPFGMNAIPDPYRYLETPDCALTEEWLDRQKRQKQADFKRLTRPFGKLLSCIGWSGLYVITRRGSSSLARMPGSGTYKWNERRVQRYRR
jgi:hypothetical protein